MRRLLIVIFSLLLLLSIFSYPISAYTDKQFQRCYSYSGKNRTELDKALNKYALAHDSLKFDATKFLIANMDDKCFIDFALFDSNKVEIPFDPLSYTNYDTAMAHLMVLVSQHPGLSFQPKKIVPDLTTIKGEMLIENVDLAFEAWHSKPWAKNLSYKLFREFILPYRGSNEPLDNWRRPLYEKYSHIANELQNSSDPVEASKTITSNELKTFVYDTLYHLHPTDQCYSQMASAMHGRCEDIANYTMFVNRANGLAVVTDFVPYWANAGNNHQWNTIFNRSGEAVSMEDGRNLKEAFNLAGRAAKVFRIGYAKQDNTLTGQLHKTEIAPQWLDQYNYIDVTKEYVNVADVDVVLPKPAPDSVRFAYLCVFNSGEWKAIDWSKIKKGVAHFHDMGRSVMYTPAYYTNKKVVPFGGTFLLTSDGTSSLVCGSGGTIDSVALYSTGPVENVLTPNASAQELSDNAELSKVFMLSSGASYALFYWENEWKMVGLQEANSKVKPVVFSHVPAGKLYWLVKMGQVNTHEERIFTIENGKQVWW